MRGSCEVYDQTSTGGLWPLSMLGNTSGAAYLSIPQKLVSSPVSVTILERPKSVMTTLKNGRILTRKF